MTARERVQAIVVAVVLIAGVTYLSLDFGVLPLFIVGIPGLLAYLLWYTTGLRHPLEPAVILPVFLLTAAGFTVHAIEEYLGRYGPAVGRLFGFAWTDQAFVVIILCLVAALSLVAFGLHRQVPVAGFVATLFLATRVAELALFVFPLVRPAIAPDVAEPVTTAVGGTRVADMPNHFVDVAGTYYFPGMLTVALPVLPAAYALYRIWITRPSLLRSTLGMSRSAPLVR
ncbi:hypothetical protein [Amycolatopsis magusensis]|uniref:Uncharacterized protein n=1 Tax=Amycolatopsis magusensis TaxID=882444 RepID=A0ABS4Q1X7_9PSEU|nr:hypothetical protein [Amycolatopsis magusensis]MBP2185680.1 hypothetical protein [Amycolatopsis magusensis]